MLMIRFIWGRFFVLGIEITQDSLADVLDIRGPVTEKGIGDPSHRLQLVLHYCIKAVFGILPAVLNCLGDAFEDDGILQNQHMGLEDSAFFVAGERFHVLLKSFKLPLGAGEGVPEALGLPGDIGDGMDFWCGKTPSHHVNRSKDDSTRDRCPCVYRFFPGAAHPG